MKKQIDFYITKASSFVENTALCLKLINKAYQHGYKIEIIAEDQTLADQLDQRLWSDVPSSFIPHNIDPTNPLRLQVRSARNDQTTMLINFSSKEIETSLVYNRILQIVPNIATLLTQARTQYRQFKQQQYHVNSHNIG